MFEILAEIGEPGEGTLTGQYPPLREVLDVDPEAMDEALLNYSKDLVHARAENHRTCLLVRVGEEPGVLAEFLCFVYVAGVDKSSNL